MSIVFSSSYPTTGQQLIERFANTTPPNQRLEAWIFADRSTRVAIEQALLIAGVKAKIRSAYKPLLHFLLEDVDLKSSGVTAINVHYPVHAHASNNRFLLESYPFSALVGQADVTFYADDTSDDQYRIRLHSDSGAFIEHKVFAPNRIHQDSIGQTHLSPTGWLRLHNEYGESILDEALSTDYEAVFTQAMEAITEHEWPEKEPFFEELNLKVTLPWPDVALDHGHEVVSLSEALHEDLYFSIQEWFKVLAGFEPKDREGQPGQIVPEISYSPGACLQLHIETKPYDRLETHTVQTIEQAQAPLSTHQIQQELACISGTEFIAKTVSGRLVAARYHKGTDAAVIISGGQHANETTGVVGALRSAQALNGQEHSHFVISPLENPDGYALHQRLIRDNPQHMHHAARYTALGDDLEYRKKGNMYEKDIRFKARDISQATLHVNLHGYPSHEWVRPFSGYVPLGFDMWTIPKGFFLILRHHPTPHWQAYARNFVTLLTEQLMTLPGVADLNQSQIALYEQHAGVADFEVINGFPCLISHSKDDDIPIQLITEYPDETVYGDHFIQGHDIQMQTVLAAYAVHQQLSKKPEP